VIALLAKIAVWVADRAVDHLLKPNHVGCPRCAELERRLSFTEQQNEARAVLLNILKKVEGKSHGRNVN